MPPIGEEGLSFLTNLIFSHVPYEVAARVANSDPVDNPRVSNWQIIGKLVENAFFKTILPGFEKEVSRSRGN